MGAIGMLAGALVPTFLVSRLFLWLLKRWMDGLSRAVTAHVISGALACLLSAMGHANGGPLDWSYSFIYLAAQAFWFAVDWLTMRGRRSAAN